MTDDLLRVSLEVAVPFWVARIHNWTDEHRQERARVCSQAVAEHGDDVLFKSRKPGRSAEAFNRLAEGIALASFAPGGVKVFGTTWLS